MNQYLKTIQDLLQQNNLSQQDREALLKAITEADKQWNITDFKLDRTEKVKKTTAILLEETIEELEHKRKAVEDQNRELEIESALERVRTAAMAMKKPADMLEVCRIISEQLELLQIKDLRNVQTAIFDVAKHIYMNYEYYRLHNKTFITEVNYTLHHVQSEFANQMLKGEGSFFTTTLTGEKLDEFVEHQKSSPEFVDPVLFEAKSLTWYWYSLGPIAFGVSVYSPMSEAGQEIVKRFRNVFDLSYRRYLDIELAIAQARESQIQLALERVRARTMAMQRSDELSDVAEILFIQVRELGIQPWSTGFNIWQEGNESYIDWVTNPMGGFMEPYTIDLTSHPLFRMISDAKKRGEDFHAFEASGESLAETYELLLSFAPRQFEEIRASGIPFPARVINHYVYGEKVGLMFITLEPCPDAWDIFKRLGKVFEQTYARFLDLQKAEAQAREGKIQLALERVRARTMAMQKSEELADVALALFQQVKDLGITTWATGFNVWQADNASYIDWVTGPTGDFAKPYTVDVTTHPAFMAVREARQRGDDFYVSELEGTEIKEAYDLLNSFADKGQFKKILDQGIEFPTRQFNHFVFGAQVSLLFVTYEPCPEAWDIFKRFGKVFEQTYTRFLDLQRAEAQARESQIEAALERVRSRSMGMQKSEELKEVIQVVYEQFVYLNIQVEHTGFIMDYKERDDMHIWLADKHAVPFQVTIPYFDCVHWNSFNEAKGKGLTFFANHFSFEEKNKFYQDLFKLFPVPDDAKEYYFSCPGLAISTVLLDNIGLYVENFSGIAYSDEENNTLMRFGKVFQQTYTRFLDLQKAEEQAREAQIEAALERVRSKTMAMHNSNDVGETVAAMFAEFMHLGISTNRCGILIFNDEHTAEVWTARATTGEKAKLIIGKLDLNAHQLLTSVHNAWKAKETFYQYDLLGDDLISYYNAINNSKFYPTQFDLNTLPSTEFQSAFFFPDGGVFSFTNEPVIGQHAKIIKRFAGVFGQTYRRYLDLQKAEAQARESQIQLALERIRARTMAMQKSDELAETVSLLFKQLLGLGVGPTQIRTCAIVTFHTDKPIGECWITKPDGDIIPHSFMVPYDEIESYRTIYDAWKNGEKFHIVHLAGDALVQHMNYLKKYTGIPVQQFQAPPDQPAETYTHALFFSQGYLFVISSEPLPEYHDIFKRFGNVFEQTYTRFLDLQKAEAQAKEAQIEAALEKVRAASMAMHHSNELHDVADVLFKQMQIFGGHIMNAGIALCKNDADEDEYWLSSDSGLRPVISIPHTEDPVQKKLYEGWKNKLEFYSDAKGGQELRAHYEYFSRVPHLKPFFEEGPHWTFPTWQKWHAAYFSQGYLFMITFEPYDEEKILVRFAKIFEQAYTRFLDLQKAEAQAREAQIEAGLERVRSRTMAMFKSDELAETAVVMFKQLMVLGIAPNRLYIAIINDTSGKLEFWMTDENGDKMSSRYLVNVNKNASIKKMYEGWAHKKKTISIDMQGGELEAWLTYWEEEFHVPFKPGPALTRRVQNIAYFSKGFIAIASPDDQPKETTLLLERFAAVFNLTYTRFSDLQQAEAQAREAKVEAALEKVRSRSLAMHKSDELQEVVKSVFDRFRELNIELVATSILIFEKGSKDVEWWLVNNIDQQLSRIKVKYADVLYLRNLIEAKENKKELLSASYSSEEKNEFFNYTFEHTDFKNVPEPVKQVMLESAAYNMSVAFGSNIGIMISRLSADLFSENDNEILKRFSKVFDQSYTRFLDLQKAEAQAREARIEASLERVRSRAMAMQNSEELNELVGTVFTELTKLELALTRSVIIIYESDTFTCHWWMANSETPLQPMNFLVKYDDQPFFRAYRKGWQERILKWTFELEGDDKIRTDDFLFSETELSRLPDFVIAGMRAPGKVYLNASFNNFGNLTLATLEPLSNEHFDILLRFAKVFDLTYTRFNDLKQAEAQAREARIETSLERVRSKTMAMHNSQDVGDTVATLFDEFVKLGIKTFRCGIGIVHEEKKMEVWTAKSDANGKVNFFTGYMDMTMHPMLQGAYSAWKKKQESYVYDLKGDDLKEYFSRSNNNPNYPLKYDIPSLPSRLIFSVFYFPEGFLFAFTLEELPAEATKIFKRFAGVFGQTYRRYLDLQKAEAQARHAQVEAAMEKVRSRALAMQKPDELIEVAQLLRKEMSLLGVEELETSSIYIHNEETGKTECWYAIKEVTHPEKQLVSDHMTIDLVETWVGRQMLEFYRSDKKQISIPVQGESRKEWINYCADHSKVLSGFYGDTIPDRTYHLYKFSNGYMGAASPGDISKESWDLLQRATSVFSFAYTRFSDLQQAEVQAREATIEAALERVRGKAMAMHNSNDLSSAASMVFTELRKLGINPIRCGVGLLNKESRKAQLYSATSSNGGDSLSLVGWVMLSGHPVMENIYDTWVRKEEYYPELTGEQLKSYYELLLSGLSVAVPDWQGGQKQYGHFLPFSVGCLYAWSDTPYNEDEVKILKRFAAIIDLTFRRYIDLQKSEANAREAVKQAALDRVRADIASMRTINDLDRITPLIWNELTILGVPFIRCGVFIMDDSQQLIHTFLSTPDGKAIAAFHIPYDTPGNIAQVIDHWHDNKNYIDHWDEKAFTDFAGTLVKQGALASAEQYLKTIPHGGFHLHFLPFLQGMLYVGNTDRLGDDEIKLIQSVADAFSTAYARYEDFNRLEAAKQTVEKTLTDLRQAQTQLVQSEKMASLGELTAGIAHEIQNPLNFVNNFSDVSNELLVEMEMELERGNKEDAIAIVKDVKQNLEKILHHGKRADAIVKGMLQHSRTSSGQKELTDINVLADEYLRLAYHGLRAKDKSFNAKFETDFDNSIEKINIIPQDIGRVMLNLINNAFYACTERSRSERSRSERSRSELSRSELSRSAITQKRNQNIPGYEPTVTVSTKKYADRIELRITDNGNGIPASIKEKIFQPFFTTKPTGQGTGLGLSLAYDIVKAHGGEIKVETKEGEGSEFMIQLPVV